MSTASIVNNWFWQKLLRFSSYGKLKEENFNAKEKPLQNIIFCPNTKALETRVCKAHTKRCGGFPN